MPQRDRTQVTDLLTHLSYRGTFLEGEDTEQVWKLDAPTNMVELMHIDAFYNSLELAQGC